MSSLNEDWTKALKIPRDEKALGCWLMWNFLGLLRVALNNFSWGGSQRVHFLNNFSLVWLEKG